MRALTTVAPLVLVLGCSVPEKHAPDAAPEPTMPDAPPDHGAPETTITEAPPAFANASSATFRFTSDDPDATFQCTVDHDTPVACTSPFTRSLGDGPHAFSVRATDLAGNTDDSPAEHQWVIDTVAPDTTITKAPAPKDNSVKVRIKFTSNEDNATFECAIDQSSYVACVSNAELGPFNDGTHVVAVRAKDRAGNVDPTPAIVAWELDASTPDTEIVSGPSGAIAAKTATFTFVSPDAGAGATYDCSLDNAPFVACTSPQTLNNLAERSHTFAVRVRDAVGNLDPTPATATWVVDLTAPTTTIDTGPTGLVAFASAAFTFSANEPGATFACSLDNTPYAACTSPFTTAMLAQGAHTFSVRAGDAAGNIDPTPATRTWTVDTVAPDVTITSGPANGGTSGPRVTFAFGASDGTISCSLDGAAFAPCTSPVAFNAPAGSHTFRVRALDAAGNAGTDQRTWTIACAGPDTLGAAGLLHLDEPAGTQTLANGVTGGAAATLGDTAAVEPGDPATVAGRFGNGLAFDPLESDHVAWPVALAAQPALTLEAWVKPDAPAGPRHVATSADGRVDLTVTAASPSTVRFAIAIVEKAMGPGAKTVTSAVVAAGAWHHVLVSVDTKVRLWVDGVRAPDADIHPDPIAFDAIRLGGASTSAFSGTLDEVWVAQTAIATDDAALARYCPL